MTNGEMEPFQILPPSAKVPAMFRPGRSRFATLMLAACLALAGLCATPISLAAAFLSIAEDVPLMPGLTEIPDTATVFDKPSGRIASTEAKGAVSAAGVRQFYAATLPQLGWQFVSPTSFRREAELLQLTTSGRDNAALTVRFELLPNR